MADDQREHEVIDETLERCLVFFSEGGVFLSYEDSDGFEHSFEDIAEWTLGMPYDDHTCDLTAVAMALRAVADRIEKGAHEPPRFKP